jgi:hypothetical protein
VNLTQVNGVVRTFPYTTNVAVTSLRGPCSNGSGDSTTVSITITGPTSESDTRVCSAATWLHTLTTPLTVNGTYTVTVTQSDAAGNVGTSGPKTIVVDTVAPIVTLTSVNGAPRTFPYTSNTNVILLAGACGTAAGDAGTVSIAITGAATQNGVAACTAGAWSYVPSPTLSAPGDYFVNVTQIDNAGNTGSSGAHPITIDTTAPAVAITNPTPSATTGPTPVIDGTRGTATGDLPTVTVKIYSGPTATGTPVQTLTDPNTGGTWTVTAATLAPGEYTVQAEQSDAGTNLGLSTPVTFTVV